MFILEVCVVALWGIIETVGAVLVMSPFGLGPLLIWLFWLWVTGPFVRRS